MNVNEDKIKKFSEKFNIGEDGEVSTKYVFIGGTALMLLSMDADYEAIRGTQDYDIVLLVKDSNGNQELFEKMWEYIVEGGYETYQTKEGTPQYFRFIKPSNKTEYPDQLEFFSNAPEFIEGREARFARLSMDDDIHSLSSIIMDDIYYDFILSQCNLIANVNCVTSIGLIVLKVKAYNDLLERKQKGANINSSNIDKHKKDIFRVLDFIEPGIECDLTEYPIIKNDINIFIENLEKIYIDDAALINVGVSVKTNMEEVRNNLRRHFKLS